MPSTLIVNTSIIQHIAISCSFLYVLLIFYMVRRKKILEEYSILWFASGFLFLGISVWRNGLDFFSALVGIAYPPAAFLLLLIGMIILILIQYSAVISSLTGKNKNLTQEVGILKLELEEIKRAVRERDK